MLLYCQILKASKWPDFDVCVQWNYIRRKISNCVLWTKVKLSLNMIPERWETVPGWTMNRSDIHNQGQYAKDSPQIRYQNTEVAVFNSIQTIPTNVKIYTIWSLVKLRYMYGNYRLHVTIPTNLSMVIRYVIISKRHSRPLDPQLLPYWYKFWHHFWAVDNYYDKVYLGYERGGHVLDAVLYYCLLRVASQYKNYHKYVGLIPSLFILYSGNVPNFACNRKTIPAFFCRSFLSQTSSNRNHCAMMFSGQLHKNYIHLILKLGSIFSRPLLCYTWVLNGI